MLKSLMGGLKYFIRTVQSPDLSGDENRNPLQEAIRSLKEQFEYEPEAIGQIKLALFLFHEAVSSNKSLIKDIVKIII